MPGISSTDARRPPHERPARGRRARLVLRRRRGALLHPVRRLPADRRARARGRHVLVERNARGVRLTEAGEALVRHTDAILARLAEAEAELEAIAGLRGGRLRMASFESAGATLMPLAIAAFRERHPGVELSMTLGEPEDSEPQLQRGELDLAIVFGSRAAATTTASSAST